jgi:RHS repeat-associated protein
MTMQRLCVFVLTLVIGLLWSGTPRANSEYATPNFDPEHDGTHVSEAQRVDTYSGALTVTHVDISLPGPGGFDLEIIRTYSSKIWQWDANHLVKTGEETTVGIGWRLDMGRLFEVPSGIDPGAAYVLELPNRGHVPFYTDDTLFVPNAEWVSLDGTWALRNDDCLEAPGTCLIATAPDGTEYQFPTGQEYRMDPNNSYFYLRTILSPAESKTITVTYAECGCNQAYIDFITDAYGRVVQFHYTSTTPVQGTCSLDPTETCFDDLGCTDYCAGSGTQSCNSPLDCGPGSCSDDGSSCDNQLECDRNCSNNPNEDCQVNSDCGSATCVGGQDHGWPCNDDDDCDNVCQGGATPGAFCNTPPYSCPGLCGPGPHAGEHCDNNGECGKYCSSGPDLGDECFSNLTCEKWCNGGEYHGQGGCAGDQNCPNLCEGGAYNGNPNHNCTIDFECANWCVGGPDHGDIGCTSDFECDNACSETGIPCSGQPLECPGANNDCLIGVCDIGTCTNIGDCVTPNCIQSICSGLGACNMGDCPPGPVCLPQPSCDFPACVNSICQGEQAMGRLDSITVSWVGGVATYQYTVDENSFVEPVLATFQTPTGQTWSYGYAPAPGDAAYDLELKAITLPSGGTIEYTYDDHLFFYPLRDTGDGYERTRVVKTKKHGTDVWTYKSATSNDWPTGQPGNRTTVVVDPLGDRNEFTYYRYTDNGADRIWKAGLLERYEVVDGGTTLLTESYSYEPVQTSNDNVSTMSGYYEAAKIGRVTEKVTTMGSKTSCLRWGGHDKYGNPAWMEEEDWNGALYRDHEYQYTASIALFEQAHVVDKPTLVRVRSGGGTVVSETSSTHCTSDSGACSFGRLEQTDTATGSGTLSTDYEYDEDGNVSLERISGSGESRTKTLNFEWGTLQSSAVEGRTIFTRSIHQASGLVLSETDANGETTSFGWDQWGRLTSIDPPGDDPDTSIVYGTTTVTVTRGTNQSLYTYDSAGRLLKNRTRIDGTTYAYQRLTYDSRGDVQSRCEPSHSATPSTCTSYTYDALGRMLSASGPDGNISFAQSADTVVINDGIGTRTIVKDAFGRIVEAREGSFTTTYGWDHNDNLESVAGPAGTRSFDWNLVGWLLSETHPETGTVSYGHNGVGDVTSRSEAGGDLEIYAHDAEGRQTQIDRPGTGNDVFFYFDGDAVPGHAATYTNASGHMTGMTDATGSTVWSERDENGRVLRVERKRGSDVYVTEFGWADGNLEWVEYPYTGGSTRTRVGYTSNDANLVESVEVNGTPIVDLIEYNPLLTPDAWHYSNGVTVHVSTSEAEMNRITSIYTEGATLGGGDADIELDFDYNARGQVGSIVRDGVLESYGYEPSRAFLTSVSYSGVGSVSYGHDSAGNITSRSSAAFPQLNFSRTHSGNRINGCGYSPEGNVESCEGRSYAYWSNNKLRTAGFSGSSIVESTYDGKDQLHQTRRIADDLLLVDFYADPLGRLSRFEGPVGGTLAPTKDWIYAAGQLVATLGHDGSAVPATCEDLGAECGTISDGCGAQVSCGSCPPGDVCVDNVCQCDPQSCDEQNIDCGYATDGCGNQIYCGSCGGGGGGGGCAIDDGIHHVIQDLEFDDGDDGPQIGGCNGTNSTLGYDVRIDYGKGPEFLSIPESGTIPPRSEFRIPVTFVTEGLPRGTHFARITLSVDDPAIPSVQIPVEFHVSGAVVTADARDESAVVQQVESFQTTPVLRWYVADHRGSTMLVLDDQGEVRGSYEYFPFGGMKAFVGCPDLEGLFQGGLRDPVSNLFDLGQRHHSPDFARFLVPDVVSPDLRLPSRWNKYLYSANDPVNIVDLLGFEAQPRHSTCYAGHHRINYSHDSSGSQQIAEIMREMRGPSAWAKAGNYVWEGAGWALTGFDVVNTFAGAVGPDTSLAGGPIIASARATRAAWAMRTINAAKTIGLQSADAITRASARKLSQLGQRWWGSHSGMTKALGSAGNKRQWHHIVEQHRMTRFGPEAIHNTRNIINISDEMHIEINKLYRASVPGTNLSLRDWLTDQSYEVQREWGLRILRKVGAI